MKYIHGGKKMERLKLQYNEKGTKLYSIEGTDQFNGGIETPNFKRYIVSTPETVSLLNSPFVAGMEYTDILQNAVAKALVALPEAKTLAKKYENSWHPVVVLRGGLAFDTRDGLSLAYGANYPHTTFLSSQRKNENGNWEIIQDSYFKPEFTDQNDLVIGEIIAGGTTIKNAVPRLITKAKDQGKNLRSLLILNIGVGNAEKVAYNFHKELAEKFDYDQTIVVYFEGRFDLAKENSNLAVKLPDTDFLAGYDALITPEFADERFTKGKNGFYENILTPCVIGDGGSRAFAPSRHFIEMRQYWSKMLLHSIDGGMTLREAYLERQPKFKNIEIMAENLFDTNMLAVKKYFLTNKVKKFYDHAEKQNSSEKLVNYSSHLISQIDKRIMLFYPKSGPKLFNELGEITSTFENNKLNMDRARKLVNMWDLDQGLVNKLITKWNKNNGSNPIIFPVDLAQDLIDLSIEDFTK